MEVRLPDDLDEGVDMTCHDLHTLSLLRPSEQTAAVTVCGQQKWTLGLSGHFVDCSDERAGWGWGVGFGGGGGGARINA